MEQNKNGNEVEIFSSSNEYETNQVCEILSDNNIPFIRKDYGSGSYMNIYFGQSIQDKKIFVSEECYDKALQLISSIFSNDNFVKEGIQELEDMEETEAEDKSHKKNKWIDTLLRVCILSIPCILVILLIIAISIGVSQG